MSEALTVDNRAVVAHAAAPRALLVPGDGGWALPPLGSGVRDYSDTSALNRALFERHRQCERLGVAPAGPVEQVRTWSISAMLRVPAPGGDLYC